jgi:hypothetical protein
MHGSEGGEEKSFPTPINLRFRPSMKGSVSKLGCEIRRGATLETRIFNENPHIRLKKPYLWLKYQCISLKNSECQNDRLLPHFQPDALLRRGK